MSTLFCDEIDTKDMSQGAMDTDFYEKQPYLVIDIPGEQQAGSSTQYMLKVRLPSFDFIDVSTKHGLRPGQDAASSGHFRKGRGWTRAALHPCGSRR